MAAPELLDRLEPLHADAFGWALHCCGATTMRRRVFWHMEELRVWFAGGGGLTEQPAAERVETGRIAALLAVHAAGQKRANFSLLGRASGGPRTLVTKTPVLFILEAGQ